MLHNNIEMNDDDETEFLYYTFEQYRYSSSVLRKAILWIIFIGWKFVFFFSILKLWVVHTYTLECYISRCHNIGRTLSNQNLFSFFISFIIMLSQHKSYNNTLAVAFAHENYAICKLYIHKIHGIVGRYEHIFRCINHIINQNNIIHPYVYMLMLS